MDDASRSNPAPRLTHETPRVPESTAAWLHVVSGSSPAIVARGVLELSARFLSSGHRVLMVDGGPHLQLHDRFDREMRWGVIECLTGEMPVLGLVQDVGRLGLYLLAHGLPAPRTHWAQLGRLLDEAHPHFGRTVLAIESNTPAAVGEALAGWHLEGWWASPEGRERRKGDRLSDRLGIHLSDLSLEAMPDAKLEALDVRLWGLVAEGPATAATPGIVAPMPLTVPEPIATAAHSEPITSRLAAIAATLVPPAPAPALVPATHATARRLEPAASPLTVASALDSDARVSERLRFLLWMRRVQTEAPRAEPAPASAATSAP